MLFCVDISSRDWLDYLATLGPLTAALIACGLAWWQGTIQEKQKKFSLFEQRYKHIYIPLREFLYRLKLKYNSDQEILDNFDISSFYNELNYSRFLIKESDFNKIKNLIDSYVKEGHSLYHNNGNSNPADFTVIEQHNQKLDSIYYEIMDIVIPYLQVESSRHI